MGYPNRMIYKDFLHRYFMLAKVPPTSPDAKGAVVKIIEKLAQDGHIDIERVRYGYTKIFFKTGEAAKIEEVRERFVASIVAPIQALALGFISRKMYFQRKKQKEAINVIQRTMRMFGELRSNPWFQLIWKVRDPKVIAILNREKLISDNALKVKECNQKKEELEKQNAVIRKEVEDLISQTHRLENDLNQLRSQLSDETLILSTKQKDRQSLKVQIEALKADTSSKQNAIKFKTLEISKLKDQIEEFVSKSDEADSSCKKTEALLNTLSQETKQTQENIEETKAKNIEADRKLKQLQEQVHTFCFVN